MRVRGGFAAIPARGQFRLIGTLERPRPDHTGADPPPTYPRGMKIVRSIRRRREPAELERVSGARTPGVQTRLEPRRVDDDPSSWLRRARRRPR